MNDMNSLVPFTKRQKLDGGNEVEEDSDNDCIIVDVEQKQSIKPNIQPANIKLGDDLDDDIVWVGQTGGQVCQQLLVRSRWPTTGATVQWQECLQYFTVGQ